MHTRFLAGLVLTLASAQALTMSVAFEGLSWASLCAWNARIGNIQLTSTADAMVSTVPEAQGLALALAGVGVALVARRRRG
jgi:MYXO-CTERM domain-containing protein